MHLDQRKRFTSGLDLHEFSVQTPFYNLLHCIVYHVHRPGRDVSCVGRLVSPWVGLFCERTSRVEGCTHLFRIKSKRVVADLYLIRNRDHIEVVTQELRA